MVNDEKREPVATPKWRTWNLPQPSSSQGLSLGPSTIIEDTAVPCR